MRSSVHKPTPEESDLSNFKFFKQLSETEIAKVNYDKTCQFYKRGSVIYREGGRLTGFYCVTRGILKIYKTGIDGKEQIIRFAKSGDIIAFRSLLSEELACTTAKVIDDAVLCHVPYQTLLYLLQDNWRFSHYMIKLLCAELREANDYVTDIAQKTVRERLAEVLLILRDQFGENEYNVLQVSLTREELANMVGTATESVIRLLSEFKSDGVIEINGRRIRFVDINTLRRIAGI